MMLNITNHKGNANQNHNELSLHTCQNSYYQKETTNVGEDVKKKRELSYIIGRNVSWYSHCGKQYGDFSKKKKKLKIELPYDPANSTPGYTFEKTKTLIQ